MATTSTIDYAAQSAIRERADKAREFTHTVGDRTFKLRRPADLRWRELIMASQGNQALLERRTVMESVADWHGPVSADLPLPCTPDLIDLYFSERPEEFDSVCGALMNAITTRRQERDAAKKASAS